MDVKEVAQAMQQIEFVLFTLKNGDGGKLHAGEAEEAHQLAQKIMEQYLKPMGGFQIDEDCDTNDLIGRTVRIIDPNSPWYDATGEVIMWDERHGYYHVAISPDTHPVYDRDQFAVVPPKGWDSVG